MINELKSERTRQGTEMTGGLWTTLSNMLSRRTMTTTGVLIVDSAPLVKRSAKKDYPDLINMLLNTDSSIIYNILKYLPFNKLEAARVVCTKFWKAIDEVSTGCNSLFQQRFVARLYYLEQLAFMSCIYPSFKEDSKLVNDLLDLEINILHRIFQYVPAKQMYGVCRKFREAIDEELIKYGNFSKSHLHIDDYAQSQFVVDRNLKIKINLVNEDDLKALVDLIEKKNSCLKNIETIYFGEISQRNELLTQKLLDAIFLNEVILFSGLRNLTFVNIKRAVTLIIPGFTGIETLIFDGVMGDLKVSYCPGLKKVECSVIAPENLRELKAAFSLRDLSNIRFSAGRDAVHNFSSFVNYPGNASRLDCVETIVINNIVGIRSKYAQKLLTLIHSKQDLLTGLKTIEIDSSVCILELPEFQKSIKVIYFTGGAAQLEARAGNRPRADRPCAPRCVPMGPDVI